MWRKQNKGVGRWTAIVFQVGAIAIALSQVECGNKPVKSNLPEVPPDLAGELKAIAGTNYFVVQPIEDAHNQGRSSHAGEPRGRKDGRGHDCEKGVRGDNDLHDGCDLSGADLPSVAGRPTPAFRRRETNGDSKDGDDDVGAGRSKQISDREQRQGAVGLRGCTDAGPRAAGQNYVVRRRIGPVHSIQIELERLSDAELGGRHEREAGGIDIV
jgi:hypothetical protein